MKRPVSDGVNSALTMCRDEEGREGGNLDQFDKFDNLSRREKEVLSMVADGKTSKQIAQTLRISPKTVQAHRANCLRKLGANSTRSVVCDLLRTVLTAN
ncbi:MAG: helix-turn-helix transcriptional regulator [Betaproteobacteria bacterium]|nr:helix-turn-helix transcriptional regulator [Betaproteobacteria bacterium]